MKRTLFAASAAALLLLSAVPAVASPGGSTTIDVPSWAWSIAVTLLIAGGGGLIRLVTWAIQRELEPVRALIPKVGELDVRMTRAEERIDVLRGEVRV